ncbi:unnamed protein product [Tuber aestivum]|uniref:Uncharacterized protein n=1 Tax=Tuber aestivum TaxID=59557 RepID=A0A292PUX5_9PEZI|nr:unnamed protein product [Tuber aestivum]
MFRILIRQTVKGGRAPYVGPASYDTLIRRYFPDVGPQVYIAREREKEAMERGEYVDIHAIGNLDPRDYDVLIPDVDDKKLRGEIAEIVGIPYHAKVTREDTDRVIEIGHCYLYGRTGRTIFPAVVGDDDRAHWTNDLFGIAVDELWPSLVTIAGHH